VAYHAEDHIVGVLEGTRVDMAYEGGGEHHLPCAQHAAPSCIRREGRARWVTVVAYNQRPHQNPRDKQKRPAVISISTDFQCQWGTYATVQSRGGM